MEIINYLLAKEKKTELVSQHGLGGFVFKNFKEQDHETCYLHQWHVNQIYFNEFVNLQKLSEEKNIFCQGLKGIFLIDSIYGDFGLRKMSDIDVLTDNINIMGQILLEKGYKKIGVTSYKEVYSKIVEGNEIAFEVHSRLYRLQNFELLYQGPNLCMEEHLYYLIYHLSYQHTFLRLNWFVDIVLYLEKYPELLEKVIILSQERGHARAFNITFYFLEKFFNFESNSKKHLLLGQFSMDFLLNPKNQRVRYHLLKNLTKKSIWDSFDYHLKWLTNNF